MIKLTQIIEGTNKEIEIWVNPDTVERVVKLLSGGCAIIFGSGQYVACKESTNYVISKIEKL